MSDPRRWSRTSRSIVCGWIAQCRIWCIAVVVPEEGHPGQLVMLAIFNSGKPDPTHSATKLIDHLRRLLTPPMARSPTTTTAVPSSCILLVPEG